jgi:hypothetical protein
VKENVGVEGVAGRDGVTVYSDTKLGRIAREEISFRLREPSRAFDLVAGKMLGRSNTLRSSITTGGIVLLSLSGEAETLGLVAPAEGRRGEKIGFSVQPSSDGDHLLRCRFFGPDGSFLPAYAQTVLVRGRAGRVTLPSALNDPPGMYRLVATDLISGAEASAELPLH